jgi:hypothetical protein
LKKKKYGAIVATLEDDLISNKMLTDARTLKSDAFLRFTIARKEAGLPIPANIEE